MSWKKIGLVVLFYIGLQFLVECSHDNGQYLLTCQDPCDSITVKQFDEGHWIEYQTINGEFLGQFVRVKGRDTIFGYNELIGSLYKKTIYQSDSQIIVKLYDIKANAEYEVSEMVVFENNEIDLEKGYFLNIEYDNRKATIKPIVPYPYDTLLLQIGKKVSPDYGGKHHIVLQDYTRIVSDSTYLLIMELDEATEGKEQTFEGHRFKLKPERFDPDLITFNKGF